LTGKAPYRFESGFLQRRVSCELDTAVPRSAATPDAVELVGSAPSPPAGRCDGASGVFTTLGLQLERVRAAQPRGTRVEVWFQDEARIGQKNSLTRVWGPNRQPAGGAKGSRLRLGLSFWCGLRAQETLAVIQLGRPSRALPSDPHRSRDGRLDRVCRRAEPVRSCRGPRRWRWRALRRRHAHAARNPARACVRWGARFRQFSLGPGVIGGRAASTPDGIWLGTYEDGPGRLFHFTAATLARLSDGETLEASQAATVLTIPDHAQGAAIGAGGYGSRAAIGTGARSIGSTLLPARRSAVIKSRLVPRASPSSP
jgi:hypothetical protein